MLPLFICCTQKEACDTPSRSPDPQLQWRRNNPTGSGCYSSHLPASGNNGEARERWLRKWLSWRSMVAQQLKPQCQANACTWFWSVSLSPGSCICNPALSLIPGKGLSLVPGKAVDAANNLSSCVSVGDLAGVPGSRLQHGPVLARWALREQMEELSHPSLTLCLPFLIFHF